MTGGMEEMALMRINEKMMVYHGTSIPVYHYFSRDGGGNADSLLKNTAQLEICRSAKHTHSYRQLCFTGKGVKAPLKKS